MNHLEVRLIFGEINQEPSATLAMVMVLVCKLTDGMD